MHVSKYRIEESQNSRALTDLDVTSVTLVNDLILQTTKAWEGKSLPKSTQPSCALGPEIQGKWWGDILGSTPDECRAPALTNVARDLGQGRLPFRADSSLKVLLVLNVHDLRISDCSYHHITWFAEVTSLNSILRANDYSYTNEFFF